jgi:hypothetical protein
VRDGSGALFSFQLPGLNPWQLKRKKAGTYSPTRSFYGGTRPKDFKKLVKNNKNKARVILEHSSQ